MTLRPIVTGACLSEDEIVWTKKLTERPRSHAVHGPWLQIHQDRTRDVASAGSFIVIYIDALQLEVRIAVVGACGVDPMLIRNHLPKLRANLVAALAALDVHEL